MPNILHTRSPLTAEIVAEYPCTSELEVKHMCDKASSAFRNTWRFCSAEERSSALERIADLILGQKNELAGLEAADTGKSFDEALSEVEGAGALWKYAAILARSQSGQTFGDLGRQPQGFTLYEPIGVVALIVPWNYPLITTSERLPFALAAGCCVVVKPSELAIGCVARLIRIINEKRLLPAGVVDVAIGTGTSIGQQLISESSVNMVSFVGSTQVGRIIESTATRAGKRVVSELGGSNYVLVYADADISKTVQAVVDSAFRNGGQACIAGSHVLVSESIATEFIALVSSELERKFPAVDIKGSPIQPMITSSQKARIDAVIKSAIDDGMELVSGSVSFGSGNRIGPVVIKNVPVSSALFREELFGPVMTVTVAAESEFVQIVNDSNYGLAAYVWTQSFSRAMSAARTIRAGRIWINSDSYKWRPELPVGGFGDSGFGRELGPNALATYSLTKSIIFE